jgi:hypothetical protein
MVSLLALEAFFPVVVVAMAAISAALPVTSYGNNQGSPTITTNITPGSGTVGSITDGVTADGFKFNSSLDRLKYIRFDFGAGTERCIDAWKIFTDASNTAGTWRWAASNDLITFVELVDLTLGGAVNNYTEYTYTNTKGYRYYILWQLPATTITTTPKYSDIKFKIDTAVAYTPPTNVAAYSNKFGFLDRTGFMTVTFSGTVGGGTTSNSIDGAATDNTTDAWFWNSGQSLQTLKYDAGSGNSFVLKEMTWMQDLSTSHGTWQLAGSNDDSSYTNINVDAGTTITLGGAANSVYAFSGNATAYRYYKLTQTSGTTSSSPWLREALFKASLT